jgi:hypothetical protein
MSDRQEPVQQEQQGGDWLADYLEWKAEHGLWGDEPTA